MQDGIDLQDVRRRVELLIEVEFGSVEEHLFATGVVDSVKAISLLLSLEKAFGLSLDELSLSDMETISRLCEKVAAIISDRVT